MPKLYEYEASYHRTTDKLRVHECDQGVHIGVNSILQMPNDEDCFEQTTSIVLPLNEVPLLIEALSHSIDNEEGRAVVALTGKALKAIIESMLLAVKVLKGEVNQSDMPYELIDALQAKFDDLLERDQAKKEA